MDDCFIVAFPRLIDKASSLPSGMVMIKMRVINHVVIDMLKSEGREREKTAYPVGSGRLVGLVYKLE